jgi:hypothetical protein
MARRFVEKTCRLCRQQKPLTDFYSDAKAPDGLNALCKTCAKEASRHYRTSARGRAMRKLRRYKDRQKIRARDAVSNAIKRGEMPPAHQCRCVSCGGPATAYHHHLGYKKEHFLAVEPVCAACHRQADATAPKTDLGTEGLPLFERGDDAE